MADTHAQRIAACVRAVRNRIVSELATTPDRTIDVMIEVADERERQNARWGQQNHPDGTGAMYEETARRARLVCAKAFAGGYGTWRHILAEEMAEAFAEREPVRLRTELVQVAAVAVSWVEAIDRRTNERNPND